MTTAAAPVPEMQRIQCSAVFGGTEVVDLDVATRGLTASIHSTVCGGAQGGDVYYFSLCSSDSLTRIAVADMQGHGEQVSHLSGWLYEILQQRMEDLDGAGLLEDLNNACHAHGFHAITTAAVFSYYVADSNLYFAYAGHPPAYLRRGGLPWAPLHIVQKGGIANLPLGVLPNVRYDQENLRLDPGDRLFVYTDGLSECANSQSEFFGDRRLIDTLTDYGDRPLPDVKNAMKTALDGHAGGIALDDDCTFMAIEVNQV